MIKYQIIANGHIIDMAMTEDNAVNELSWYEFYLEKYPDNKFILKQIKLLRELLESNK